MIFGRISILLMNLVFLSIVLVSILSACYEMSKASVV